MTVSRRSVLLAAATAPLVWTVPQVVSVSVAHAADIGSRPPAQDLQKVVAPHPMAHPPLPTGIQLAYTGQETRKEVEVAAAALVAGAAIVAVTHRPKRETL